jgi:hypothetical protein
LPPNKNTQLPTSTLEKNGTQIHNKNKIVANYFIKKMDGVAM